MSLQILSQLQSLINPANEHETLHQVIYDELGTVENAIKAEVIEAIMQFIPNNLLNQLQDITGQIFENDQYLFEYIQKSMILQINDKQMKQFKVSINGKTEIISIIHFDFYVKGTNECFYGILINPNKWELDEFLTAQQILTKHGIKHKQLPQSSRKMDIFINQMQQKLNMHDFKHMIDETNWYNVQIKASSGSVCSVTMQLTPKIWSIECKKSFKNKHLPLIPVIIIKDNEHWIEWVKIIEILSENGEYYLGVSCKYNKNQWNLESIYLDIDDIYNDHRFIDLNQHYDELKYFKSSIEAIEFKEDLNNNNEYKDDMEQLNTFNLLQKQHILNQDTINKLQKILASFTEAEQHENNKAVHVNIANIDDNDDGVYCDTELELQSDWEQQ